MVNSASSSITSFDFGDRIHNPLAQLVVRAGVDISSRFTPLNFPYSKFYSLPNDEKEQLRAVFDKAFTDQVFAAQAADTASDVMRKFLTVADSLLFQDLGDELQEKVFQVVRNAMFTAQCKRSDLDLVGQCETKMLRLAQEMRIVDLEAFFKKHPGLHRFPEKVQRGISQIRVEDVADIVSQNRFNIDWSEWLEGTNGIQAVLESMGSDTVRKEFLNHLINHCTTKRDVDIVLDSVFFKYLDKTAKFEHCISYERLVRKLVELEIAGELEEVSLTLKPRAIYKLFEYMHQLKSTDITTYALAQDIFKHVKFDQQGFKTTSDMIDEELAALGDEFDDLFSVEDLTTTASASSDPEFEELLNRLHALRLPTVPNAPLPTMTAIAVPAS